jgi:hypothetical protein
MNASLRRVAPALIAALSAALFMAGCASLPPAGGGKDSAAPKVLPIMKDGQYGYVDSRGSVIVQPSLEQAGFFSEGLARVKSKGLWGFIDASGAFAIQPSLKEAGDFSEGLAPAKDGELYGYVDKKGAWAIPAAYQGVSSFRGGRALVIQGKLGGYIDAKGKLAIPLRFEGATDFSEGLAVVSEGGATKCIDARGKTVIDLAKYKAASGCVENLILVYDGKGYGFIDKAGKEVIPCSLALARDFHEGRAAAMKDGLWGFIDKTGAWVLKPAYATLGDLRDGRACFKADSGKYGFIDETGAIRVAPRYSEASVFKDGYAWVTRPLGSGYIDPDGRYAWCSGSVARQGGADFSGPDSGFDASTDWKVADGRFRHAAAKRDEIDKAVFLTQVYGDSQCSVKASWEDGDEYGSYGIIIRYKSDAVYSTSEDYVCFGIDSEGQYGIFADRDGKKITLSAWKYCSLIKTGKAENALAAVAKGDRIRLYINGVEVAEVADPSLGPGYARAGLFAYGPCTASFDDFDLREAAAGDAAILPDTGVARTVGADAFLARSAPWKASEKRLEYSSASDREGYINIPTDTLSRSYKVGVTVNYGGSSNDPSFGLMFNYIEGEKQDGSDEEYGVFWAVPNGQFIVTRYAANAEKILVPKQKHWVGDGERLEIVVLPTSLSFFMNGQRVAEIENAIKRGQLVRVGVTVQGSGSCSFKDFTIEDYDGIPELEKERSFAGPGGKVRSLAYSPDGKILAAGGETGSIALYATADLKPLRRLEGPSRGALGISFSADGSTLAAIYDDRVLRLWDLASGTRKGIDMKIPNQPDNVAFSPDGKMVVVGTGGLAEFYDVAKNKYLEFFMYNSKGIINPRWSPDGSRIIAAAEDGTIFARNLAHPQGENEILVSPIKKENVDVSAFAASADLAKFAYGGPYGVRALAKGSKAFVWRDDAADDKYVKYFAFSPDGAFLASETRRVWMADTGKGLGVLPGKGPIAFGLDSRSILTGEEDGTISLWKIR